MLSEKSAITEHELINTWFYDLKSVGEITRINLLSACKTVEDIFYGRLENISDYLNKSQYKEIEGTRCLSKLEELYGKVIERGIKILRKNDEEYPDKLKNIYDPPGILYIKGDLKKSVNDTDCNIAMVGSRKADTYGREVSYHFARTLAEEGITIISGLALGIDGYSHRGALAANGYSVGVLGCGINITYPASHAELFCEMERNGAIVSEYGLDMEPFKSNFPRRNRIISALSDGVLVVEAGENSGSLITADFALEQGKQIYAIPGRLYDRNNIGTNNLIKQGAIMVTEPRDILLDLRGSTAVDKPVTGDCRMADVKNALAPLEKMVYSCLSLNPVYIDELVNKLNIGVKDLISTLYSMQEKGVIKEVVKGYYIIAIKGAYNG